MTLNRVDPTDTICRPFPQRSTALILNGNARSFVDPRVYSTIRHNLIEGYGGNMQVFAWIKTDSQNDKPGFRHRFKNATTSTAADLRTALAYLSQDGLTRVHHNIVHSAPNVFNPLCRWRSHKRHTNESMLDSCTATLKATK